jgi:hypothetical protein
MGWSRWSLREMMRPDLAELKARYGVVFRCSLRSLPRATCGCAAQLDRLLHFGVKNQKIGRQ